MNTNTEETVIVDAVKQAVWTLWYYLLLGCFAIGIYSVNIICLILSFLLPVGQARRLLRRLVHALFRLYIGLMIHSGALHSNCDLLKRLRPGAGGRLIIANHPSILDAPIFLSLIPGLVCVFKSSLKRRFTMARTAGTLAYLSNDEGIVLLKEMAARLKAGEQVLVFPEGTRTSGEWVDPFNPGYALAAIRAQVPVQLVRIRSNSPILSKRQPFYRAARFPVSFNFDFGPCIEPGTFSTVKAFNAFVEEWYRTRLPMPDSLQWPFLPVDRTRSENSDGSCQVSFRVSGDPVYCHGHMPDNPIVPGYAQMAWVHEILRELDAAPTEYFRWKFLQPILPGDTVEVCLGPPADRRVVRILRNGERVTHGKLICRQPEMEATA